jgi:cytochrome P450
VIGEAPPSPAGPIADEERRGLPEPPWVEGPRALQILRFNQRQHSFVFRARREHGEVWRMRAIIPGCPAVTSHPDHVRSLFTARPDQAPSLTAESPLRPIVGSASVLTAQGARHLRQRKLLLPPFHGEAIERYAGTIADATDRELSRWPVGEPIALAPRMQAITLDVIMSAVFGIEGVPAKGTPERRLRRATRAVLGASTKPLAQIGELSNIGRTEPVGLTKVALGFLDRPAYEVIAERRRAADLDARRDILSMLLLARTEEGEALSDREVRDELLTLVLAGHETTANQLAWTWERLVRAPEAHERLRAAVREESSAAEEVEAVITESMRSRPVIPIVGRRVQLPWRLGAYGVPAGTPVSMSILLVHHREDLYPDPYVFRPERWHGHRPGTYSWLPFGGGTRRCLGAALAMAEMRVVLESMARRLDLEAAEPEAEKPLHRNVTMIPARGGRVVVRGRR